VSLDHLSNGEVGEDPGQGGVGQHPGEDHLLHLLVQLHPLRCLAEPLASLLDADTIPPSLPLTKLLTILESLWEFLSSCLRQEEGGESAKERAEAKDKEGEYGGELGKVDNHRGEEDGNSSHNLTKGNPLPSDDGWKDLAAVLEADEVGSVHRHSSDQSDREAHPWQVVRNESIDNPADTRASEEEKKRPATTHLGNDERHRPAGDLYQGAKEVALVDVPLTQVGSILDVAVVAHEPHHADDSAEKGVEAKIFRFEHLEESGFGDWIV